MTTCDSAVATCDGAVTTCDGRVTTCGGAVTTCDGAVTTCDCAVTTCDGAVTTGDRAVAVGLHWSWLSPCPGLLQPQSCSKPARLLGRGSSAPCCGIVPRRQLVTPGGWAPCLWASGGRWTRTTAAAPPGACCFLPSHCYVSGFGGHSRAERRARVPGDPLATLCGLFSSSLSSPPLLQPPRLPPICSDPLHPPPLLLPPQRPHPEQTRGPGLSSVLCLVSQPLHHCVLGSSSLR